MAGRRLPARIPTLVLSPDERSIATTLHDGGTTNLWVIPTDGGPMKVTDFGARTVVIAQSVCLTD